MKELWEENWFIQVVKEVVRVAAVAIIVHVAAEVAVK